VVWLCIRSEIQSCRSFLVGVLKGILVIDESVFSKISDTLNLILNPTSLSYFPSSSSYQHIFQIVREILPPLESSKMLVKQVVFENSKANLRSCSIQGFDSLHLIPCFSFRKMDELFCYHDKTSISYDHKSI